MIASKLLEKKAVRFSHIFGSRSLRDCAGIYSRANVCEPTESQKKLPVHSSEHETGP